MDLARLGAYFGTWLLDPATCRYGDRPAPRSGTYALRWARDAVAASVSWTDAEGASHQTSFEVVPDGVLREVAGHAVVARLDDRGGGFVTEVVVGGRVVHRAVRSLPEPDTLRVVQSGVDPDGTEWVTEARYRRVDDFPAPNALATDYDTVADRYAAEFDDELSRKPFDRELLASLAAELAPGPIADLGCGPGQIGAFVAARGVEVVGVDLSEGMLAEGRRRHPELRFVRGDLLALPLDDASFAGVVAFYCLMHLRRADLPQAFAEIRRVLRPGGVGLIALHEGAGVIGLDAWYERPVTVRVTLVGEAELRAIAEGAGLTVVRCDLRPPYPFEAPTRRLYLRVQA